MSMLERLKEECELILVKCILCKDICQFISIYLFKYSKEKKKKHIHTHTKKKEPDMLAPFQSSGN